MTIYDLVHWVLSQSAWWLLTPFSGWFFLGLVKLLG